MSEQIFDIGDRPTIVVKFTQQSDGLAADPSGITFKIKEPDGTTTTEDQTAATNPSTGTWHWPLPAVLDAEGWHHVNAVATAGLACAAQSKFKVRASQFD